MPKGTPRRLKSYKHYKSNGGLKDTPQGSNPITDPEEDEEEENEGDPEGGYANWGHLTSVPALRAPVETRWNSWYYMIERYGEIL